MKQMKVVVAGLLLAATLSVGTSMAQIVTPQPSPLSKVEQRVGLNDLTVTYSRPSLKGRKIFGEQLTWGEIWRFGANSSTKFKTSDSINIGGSWLAPGEYAVYATPNEKSDWVVYFNKNANQQAWDFKVEEAAAKVSVKPEMLTSPVETFTLGFSDLTNTSANLQMQWDKYSIKVPMRVEFDGKVMRSIQKTMGDVGPYWAAAQYYLDNGKDQKQALEWVNRVLEKNKGYWVQFAKAKIQRNLGDNNGAIETAKGALEAAKADKDNAYMVNIQKFLDETKPMPVAKPAKGKK